MKDDIALLMPKYRYKSILDVTASDLKKMGAKAVGLDVDNTVVPDGRFTYTEGIHKWLGDIQNAGIPIMIISNANIIRVSIVARQLGGLPYIHLSRKPSTKALLKAADRMGVQIHELAMIGDQLFSDIKAANLCGAIPVRIDPLSQKSIYPHYYRWREKREVPIIEEFEKHHGYGFYND